MSRHQTMHCYNLMYYTPKLWEKFVLWFCPLRTHEAPTAVVWYKTFVNRMYIFGYIRVRDVDDTYTTGSNATQINPDDNQTGYNNAGNN